MNAKVFKNLIKEAVREAVREEIGVLLLEQKKQELNENKTFSFTSSDIPTGNNNEAKAALRSKMGEAFGFKQSAPKLEIVNAVDENTGERINPFAAFLADSAANMTAQDLSGLRNLG